MGLTSVSNKVDGVAAWDKAVTDVNDVDESFANARDLGYSRLNNTRISVIGRLGKYDSKDLYRVQVLSNGKLFMSMRVGDDSDEKVLDLSKYDQQLAENKANMEALGIKDESTIDTTPQTPLEKAKAEIAKKKEEREKAKAGLLDEIAPGMTIKVYMQKGKKTVLVGDSTAAQDSKQYEAMKQILNGDYRAKKGTYYVEVSSTDSLREEKAYVFQIKQGKKYVNDYLVKEGYSSDSKNKKITKTSSVSSSEQISSAYAAQIQAQKYEATTTMLTNAYMNFSEMTTKKTAAEKLLSTINTMI
ncbi:MAG: hypothetical protein MJ210_00810 [Alphaproteobacteria bacterium]|nr:hypothetical protein [Alphaproteobacteria bacterium]